MKTDQWLTIAVLMLLLGMGFAIGSKDPWPLICATIVFLVVYLERALLDRQELESIMADQKDRINQLLEKDSDIEELKTQINALQLAMGMKHHGK